MFHLTYTMMHGSTKLKCVLLRYTKQERGASSVLQAHTHPVCLESNEGFVNVAKSQFRPLKAFYCDSNTVCYVNVALRFVNRGFCL